MMRMRFTRVPAIVLALAAVATALYAYQDRSHAGSGPIYLDPQQPVQSRVSDLLGRMTLAEKVGQMALISVSRLWGDCQGSPGALNPGCLARVLTTDDVGSILSGGGEAPTPNTPQAWAELTNAIQKYAVDHSRLHIPIIYGADAVHGHNNVLGATIFPHNIGMAATWDPALAQSVAASTARSVLATGVHWTFSPVADIARDLRWGRYYETFGEDPYLDAQLVAAEVKGYQGTNFSTGVSATVKHFIGYSEPIDGHDRVFAELSLRYLRETYFPSFEAGIQQGVGAVMADSGSVDGVPVHASTELLTNVLRGQMGFSGLVVSDWQDVEGLYTNYHVATSEEDAVRLAVLAGVDLTMVPYDADGFTHNLLDLVQTGKVQEARIDEAVRRILTLKFELGLFDHPYVDAAAANAKVLGADRDLALRAAEESMVLLQNRGNTLPLATGRTILVTGSSASSIANQMGGWTVGWQGVPAGQPPPATTVLQGIEHAVSGHGRVVYAPGTYPRKAATLARRASTAVVVVGETPYAEGLGDTTTAALSSADARLLDAVLATPTPTVIVLIGGRPLMIAPCLSRARSVLMAWLPGTEGGQAVANVLFGKYNPGGQLPVSWPHTIGQAPLFYGYLPGTNVRGAKEYNPLYPFGYGLSYARFIESGLHVEAPVSTKGKIAVTVRVTNAGRVAGDTVVEAYVHMQQSPVLVPALRLVGFRRVHLGPGKAVTVTFSVPTSRLAVIPGDITGTAPATVIPGHYTVSVGKQSVDFSLG
jgi:beta-glucosidase